MKGEPDQDMNNEARMTGPSFRGVRSVEQVDAADESEPNRFSRGQPAQAGAPALPAPSSMGAQASTAVRHKKDGHVASGDLARYYGSRASLEDIRKRQLALFERFSTVKVILVPLANVHVTLSSLAAACQTMFDFEARAMGLPPQSGFRFQVFVERPRQDPRSYLPMDFPVYVVSTGTTVGELVRIVHLRGVELELRGANLDDYVRRNWNSGAGDYGISIPAQPSKGNFAAVGFVDEVRIARDFAVDLPKTMANVVVHEFVHMAGVTTHERSGNAVMRPAHASQYSTPRRLSVASRNALIFRLTTLRAAAVDGAL